MQPTRSLRICARLMAAALLLSACERTQESAADAFPILTPAPPATPRINGAKVFGVRPGSPFLYQIAATGERPMEFAAAGLPDGLALDVAGGLITGTCAAAGEYLVTLRARNPHGATERPLRVVVGDEISLTPPMGWNTWNIWSGRVTQERVATAARAMVERGLRDHGWSFVNIDDGWQGLRGGELNALQPNSKFPDMQRLADQIHAAGLKFGIYSTPWRTSFHGHLGSSADYEDGTNDWLRAGQHDKFYKFEFPREESRLEQYSWLKPMVRWLRDKRRDPDRKKLRTFGRFSFVKQDVAQWSRWGADYLKYDWIPIDVPHAEEMARELRECGRDVVLSLANNAPFASAAELSRIGNAWRTSGDVRDTWEKVSQTGFSRDRWAPFSRPGHYNDPDMLVLGEIGWGKPRRTRLTADEQYAHTSLWCLLAAPLVLGCDLDKLDDFTLGLLTNDEVLEVNQDPLCKQATRVAKSGNSEVYAKQLEDGSWAVGLFNRGGSERRVRIDWSVLGLREPQQARDLWRQKNLGAFADHFEAPVPAHGVVLLRIWSAAR